MLDRPARVFVDGMLGDLRLDHPEGVTVAADGSVWCGGERGQVYRVEPDGSAFEQVAATGGFCAGVAFGPDGALYACDVGHVAVMRMDVDSGAVQRYAEHPGLGIPNSLAFDAAGNLYVSDSRGADDIGPALYRFEAGGRGELWCDAPLAFANGLALAPDGSALYVVESRGRCVRSVAIQPDGSAGAVETAVELPGTLPDGLAFAADESLYVACYAPSQVLRVELDGGRIGVVANDPDHELLAHPTNVAFRGTDLFTANLGRWHLTVIDAGVAGAPLPVGAG